MRHFILLSVFLFLLGCREQSKNAVQNIEDPPPSDSGIELIILGTAQDAGYPQIACSKKCCELYKKGLRKEEYPTSLAIINWEENKYWLFEASPKINPQITLVNKIMGNKTQLLPSGIFLSHAHIGHYTGLMLFGREALGSTRQKVYAMPRMIDYLKNNGPWNQLVELENIQLDSMKSNISVRLSDSISVTPLEVPHRDEFSETVGFVIQVNQNKILFIPDIDKWSKWNLPIDSIIQNVNYAFLDGTFMTDEELPGRNMNEIPHPFIKESVELFSALDAEDKGKVHFIHFNHSNPILWDPAARKKVEELGYNIAYSSQRISL